MLSHVAVAGVVLTAIAGSGPGGVLLAVGGAGVAIGAWVRLDRRLRPPAPRTVPRSFGLRWSAIVAAIVLTLVFGAGGGGGGATAVALATTGAFGLAGLAVVIARSSASLAAWCRDDRAGGLGDLAFTAAIFTLVVVVLLQIGRLLGSLTAVPLLDPDGLGRGAGLVARLGLVSWWVIQMVSDGLLLVSVVLCRLHRLQHDEIAERRFERESQWNDEIAGRFDDHADDDA